MREEINNHLLRSNPGAAAEVRRIFDHYDRTTILYAESLPSDPERAAIYRDLLDFLEEVFDSIAAGQRHASKKAKLS